MTSADTTLAILAGGRGTRMGLRKDRVRIHGAPVLSRLLERMAWPGPTLLVGPSDRTDVVGQESVDRVVYDDAYGEGPLRGIDSALRAMQTPALLVVPIDMPGLAAIHLEWLVKQALGLPDAIGIMLRRGVPGCARLEPFPLWCHARCRASVSRLLAQGERSVRALAGMPDVHAITPPPAWGDDMWWNLNAPDDVARFEAAPTRLDDGADPPGTPAGRTSSPGRCA